MYQRLKKLPKSYFLVPVILLLAYLIIRLIDQAQLITYFPLDITNDISAHITQLFFLKECGFHNICTYWYNDMFTLFLLYPPGWYFYTYPLYLLTDNLLVITYISFISMYILGFIFIYILGKTQKLSLVKTLFLFALFFVNPINIGNFIRLGRLTSMFSWIWIILALTLIIYYKDKELDKYFWILPIALAISIISHISEAILALFTLLPLFLIKSKLTDRIKIILAGFFSLVISAFWLIPFLSNTNFETTLSWAPATHLLQFSGQWLWTSITSFIIIPGFFILFYLYWRSKAYSKKELFFYSPILILALIVLTRIIAFLPIFNSIYPDDFFIYLSFFSFLLLVKTKYPENWHKPIKYLLIILTILLISTSLYKTSFFPEKTQLQQDTKELLPLIDDRYHLIGDPEIKDVYGPAVYSYAPVYHNLSSLGGWMFTDIPQYYQEEVGKIDNYVNNGDCENLWPQAKKLNTNYLMAFTHNCEVLRKCSLKEVKTIDKVCLYKF